VQRSLQSQCPVPPREERGRVWSNPAPVLSCCCCCCCCLIVPLPAARRTNLKVPRHSKAIAQSSPTARPLRPPRQIHHSTRCFLLWPIPREPIASGDFIWIRCDWWTTKISSGQINVIVMGHHCHSNRASLGFAAG